GRGFCGSITGDGAGRRRSPHAPRGFRPMSLRLLSVHNYYKHPGGEDVAFESEVELLRQHGHEVATYVRQNRDLDQMTVAGRLSALVGSVWSRRTYDELLARIGD